MDFATNFANAAVRNGAMPVATAVVILTTIEPVCKLVKAMWERFALDSSKDLKTQYTKTQEKFYSEATWTEMFTKMGMTFNKYRPFANEDLSFLSIGFLIGAIVLNTRE